jgi:peptidoglycan/xylan/chitin deacetylase (PgdA/CDA1 family)
VRRGIVILFALTLGWALSSGVCTAAADTTVSLTFDDGNADQMPAVQMLDDHGMEGTFYIIPGRVGRPDGYMTWSQVQTIFDHGNEIGGHTRNHVHLDEVSESTARTEICGGRDDLIARGYPQVSFAYPFGDHDATSEELVQECGYLSGRGVSGLQGETGEPDAESIPPVNPWVVHTRGSVDVNDTLPEVKDWIMLAEAFDDDNGPGDAWIPLVFHHLCDPDVTDCSDPDGVDDQYMTPSDFDALLDWLQARSLIGTNVKTVEQVMTGEEPQDTTPPVSQIRCDGATCSSSFYNHNVSATLSATDTGGSGLKEIRYTTNGSNPTTSSPLYTGAISVSATTTIKFRAWDNAGNAEAVKSQTISIDTAKPTSSIQCNGAACASGFYNASVSATLSGSDSGGSGLKNIRYTTNGSDPTGSSPIYSGAINVPSTTTIKWRAEDNAGNVESIHSQTIQVDTARPTSAMQCDGAACSSSFYNHSVSATLSGNDTGGSGLKNVRYTTDGSNPTGSSPIYSGPIAVDGTTTIKFRAEDNAGNVESPVKTQVVSIDTATPTSSIQCDGTACQPTYEDPVKVTLSGGDTGGSGLKGIRYTLDGSTPTSSSPLYAGPIVVDETTAISFRAEDNAGNLEPVNSQAVEITGTTPPPPPPPPPGDDGTPGSSGGTLGAFASSQAKPNGTVKLTLDVTGPGELEAVDGSVVGTAAVTSKKRTARIRRASHSVAQAGAVTLVLRTSKAGKRILRRKGRLTVPVRVTFTPLSGSSSSRTVRVKFVSK